MTNRNKEYFFENVNETVTLFWTLIYGAARLLTSSILKTRRTIATALLINKYIVTYQVHYTPLEICCRMKHYVFGPILGEGSDNAAAKQFNPNAEWAPQISYVLEEIETELGWIVNANLPVPPIRPENDQFFHSVFRELRRFATEFLDAEKNGNPNYDYAYEVAFLAAFVTNRYHEWGMKMERFHIYHILHVYLFGHILGMSSGPVLQLNNIGNPIHQGQYCTICQARVTECPNARYGKEFTDALDVVYKRLPRPPAPRPVG